MYVIVRFVAGGKYEPVLVDNAYKIHMKLTISSVSSSDFGSYKCVSRNSLGDTDGSIKVYRKYRYVRAFLSTKIFVIYLYVAERSRVTVTYPLTKRYLTRLIRRFAR